jgi:hypothetical protein
LVFRIPNKIGSKVENMVELCGGDENAITNEFGIAKTIKVRVNKHQRPKELNEKRSVQTWSIVFVKTNICHLC